MKKYIYTLVLEDDDGNLNSFWNGVRKALKTETKIVEAASKNIIAERNHLRKIAARALTAVTNPPTLSGPKTVMVPTGEHFWLSPIGLYANNRNLLDATKIYETVEEIATKEGSVTIKD